LAIHYNVKTVTDGLVLALDAANPKSYSGYGTTWSDLSGNSNTGTLVNSPIYNTIKGTGTRTDTNASSLVLAIPMDGANNGTTFTDESASIRGSGTAKTITRNGDTKTVTAISKFYGSSGYFDATGDYLNPSSSADFAFGTGDFTIEFWANSSNVSGASQRGFFQISGTAGGIQSNYTNAIHIYQGASASARLDGGIGATIDNVIFGSNTAVLTTGTWYHIALTRSSGTVRVFVNGNLHTSGTSTANLTCQNLCVGGYYDTSYLYDGYLQDLRIYKGLAKYTSNFVPFGNPNTAPTGAFPIYNTQDTGGSLVFNGSNQYATTGNNFMGTLTTFTVSHFIKLSANQTSKTIFSNFNQFNGGGWVTGISDSTTNVIKFYLGSATLHSTTALTNGVWYCVTVTYDNGSPKIYINGSLDASSSNTIVFSTPGNNDIGRLSSGGQYFNGNIAQVSIYNRALSAAEITQNYNALKSRYISAPSIPTPTLPIIVPNYEQLTYIVSGNLTATGNGTTSVDIFKTSGSGAWDNQAYSTTAFSAPCTIEFNKQAASTDNTVSYAMIGWNEDPTANASYGTLDYTSFPYMTNTYEVYHNASLVQSGGTWNTANKLYVVYGTDGFIRHYNGSTLLYSVNYGTGRTVYVDSSFYSVNSTFGGFSNIKVIRSAWNGVSYA
jgi:hypothetical protein